MRPLLYFVFILSSMLSAIGDVTYELEAHDGRKIMILDPIFDGKVLRAVRQDSGQSIKMDPGLLSEASWVALNTEITRDCPVELSVRWTDSRKIDKYLVNKQHFDIRVTSKSYFSKEIKVVYYMVDGVKTRTKSYDASVSKSLPYEFTTLSSNGIGGWVDRNLNWPVSLSDKFAVAVVVENRDGTICELYAPQVDVKEVILACYAKRKTKEGM